MINLFKMSLQIHNIKFPQVYLWTFWCANKRSPFLQKRIFGFFFSKSCLKVGGAAYTRVFTVYCNRFPTMESVSLTLTFHTTLASGARSKEWQALPSPARPGLARSWPGLPGKRGLEKPGKPGSRPGFWGKPGYRSMAFPATLKSRPPFHGFLGEKTRSRESQEFVAIFYKWQQ